MEWIFIGICIAIGMYLAPFIFTFIMGAFVAVLAGFVYVIDMFKRR